MKLNLDPDYAQQTGDEPIIITITPQHGQPISAGLNSRWGILANDGWDNLSPRRTTPTPRALAHGAFPPASVRRDSTNGTLKLTYEGTRAEVAQAAMDINGACAGIARIEVTDHNGTRASRIATFEHVQAGERHGNRCEVLDVTIVWSSPDPRRYGRPLTKAANEACINVGTAPVRPVISITGPVSSAVTVTEVETGRTMRHVGPVGSTQTLRLDPALGMAVLDGQPSMGLRQMEWPLIPAGETRTYKASAGKLSVEMRSAWW